MMWKCLHNKSKKGGFTLLEMMAVVAIIVVLLGVTVFGIVSARRTMQLKEYDDYAKTVFMAAQSNLAAMRASGELEGLQMESESGWYRINQFPRIQFPDRSAAHEYYWTSIHLEDDPNKADTFAMVLPVNSVEAAIRDNWVLIEYNPITGNVYSAFYCPANSLGRETLWGLYLNGNLPRDEASRRSLGIGYYCGSLLTSNDLEPERAEVEMEFNNGEEGILSIDVAIPNSMTTGGSAFMDGLDVKLIMTGEISGNTMEVQILDSDGTDLATVTRESGDIVRVRYVLDSLADRGSFANLVAGEDEAGNSLTNVTDQRKFALLPGENLTIQAEITYNGGDAAVEARTGILAGVNPMFDYLVPGSNPGEYVLAVSNGRNLQNLNALVPSIADAVELLVFSDDIYWNQTVSYYNSVYGTGGVYANAADEAPARALPYFVPIHNELLLGSAWFTGTDLQYSHENYAANGTIMTRDFADVVGNGKMVVGLNIDSTRYAIPEQGHYYVTDGYYDANGQKIGGKPMVGYHYTGLFAYVNTNVSDLNVVNSFVKGMNFGYDANITTATGSLVGVVGPNALLTGCGAYIVTDSALVQGYFDYGAMGGPKAYSASGVQSWYGVSGEGAVGGLVGYAMSSRVAGGDLTGQSDELTFLRCFAAVPVSGNMRGNGNQSYGYTNGVGGLAGVSNLSNFLSCYASGDMLAKGVYVSGKSTAWSILNLDGAVSAGAGGLVGTSHGSRFSNCFATGDVTGDAQLGVGGFVGVMCYDGGFTYRCDGLTKSLKQVTVFNSCYCVGEVTNAGGATKNFAGGMASDTVGSYITADSKIYTDYYLMYAPYWAAQGIGMFDSPGSVAVPNLNSTNSGYFYLYKDCYFLDKSLNDDFVLPNKEDCASACGYSHFMNMLANHGREDTTWILNQVIAMGECTNEYGQSYQSAYLSKYWGLYASYYKELARGYDKVYWVDATEEITHPYSFTGGKYLFPLTSGMEYYGDWPTFPLSGGLAYYEYYSNGSGIHVQFDREDTGTLATAQNLRNWGASVTRDGYAVVLAGGGNVTVKLGEKTFDLSGVGTVSWDYEGSTVTLYPLTAEVMAEAAALAQDSFYVAMTITSGSRSYLVYFNPNVANSQINPVMTNATEHVNPDAPTGAPSQVQIRTARHLAALSDMENFWTSNYRYIQLLDINAGAYTGDCTPSGAIGNEATPFRGSYAGANGQVSISGYRNGIFGAIGTSGSVKDVVVIAQGTAGSSSVEYAGVVADVNHGTLDNVDVKAGSLTVQASLGSGLLAGFSDGTIRNCDVSGTGTVHLTADDVGGAVGVLAGSATKCKVSFSGTYQTDGGTGGFVGETTNANVSNVQVTLDGDFFTNEFNFGGFGCELIGGNYSKITVIINGNAPDRNSHAVSGFADTVDDVSLDNLSVTINGNVQSNYAAGLISGMVDSSLSGSTVTVNGTLDGTDFAAGGIIDINDYSTVSTTVAQIRGTVCCADFSAQGFAILVQESAEVTGCEVRLDGGTVTGKFASGFAHWVLGEASGYCGVIGNGTINGTQDAAGFVLHVEGLVAASRVTPAVNQSADAYWGLSNDQLVVTGGNVAGFALVVHEEASVINCDTLCTVSGSDRFGFAQQNMGIVEGCIANVTITGGNAFVGINIAKVSDCYGWYGDGLPTNSTVVTQNGLTSCYFVDRDSSEENNPQDACVKLVDYQGRMETMRLSDLNSALGKLNGDTMGKWQIPGAFAGYPYSQIGSYSFPMLREHCGDWSTTTTNFFGVIYYERYEADVYKLHVVELSTARGEQASSSFYWNNGTMQATSCFDATGTIVDAGYLLFCKEGTDPFGGDLIGGVYTGAPVVENLVNTMAGAEGYRIYSLNTTEKFVFYSLGQTVEVVSVYADAIGSTDTYQIRTPYQLANIHKEAANFIQTRDITLEGDFNVLGENAPAGGVTLSTVYNGNGFKIDATAARNSWIRTLGGTVKNLTLVVGELDSELIRTVNGGASVSGLKLILTQPMASGKAVFGTVFGGVQLSSVTLNGNMEGMLVKSVSSGTVQIDSLEAKTTGASVGTLIGTVNGGVIRGQTWNLSKAVVNDYLIESLTGGATLEGVRISVQDLRRSLIGTLTGTVTGIKTEVETASIGADGGILAANVKKTYDSTGTLVSVRVENCEFAVTTVNATGAAFGTVCKVLPSGAVIANCTVEVDTLQTNCQNVGGLVANSEGDLENNQVTVKIEARDCAIVGGAVAVSNGYLTNNTVQVTIRYTQTNTELADAMIGGLIGRADGGGVSADPDAVSVSGAIILASEAVNNEKRNYIVGGVLGKENTTSLFGCTGIQANVAIDQKWAGASSINSYVQDIGQKGPVGMFAGYVYRGSYVNCSTIASNSLYHFAGQYGYNNYRTSGGNWFVHSVYGTTQEFTMASTSTLRSVAQANGFRGLTDGQEVNVLLVGMENCSFTLNGKTYVAGIGVLHHVFAGAVMESAGEMVAVFTHRYVAGYAFSTLAE